MGKFIVYKHYSTICGWGYERVELTRKELKKYLFRHQSELENIEVVKKMEKAKININVNIDIF